MNNLRKSRIWVLVALIIAGAWFTYRSYSAATQAREMEQFVYCNATVQVTFPDRRFLGSVGHSPQGGIHSVQDSMTLLDHDGMPPRPWPDGWQFSVHGSNCFKSWAAMHDTLNLFTLGRVSSLLDPSAPLDEANFRQAVLKTLFKDQFEAANQLFPPARLAMSEE